MKRNVIVIGGGIIGLSTAYYLIKAGHQVTVLDKSTMTQGASYVNAGYLTPSHIIPLASPGMITKGLRYMFNSASPFYMKPRFDLDFLKWAWYFKKASTRAKVEKAIPVIKDINILSRELFLAIKDSGDLGSFHLERKGLLMLYKTAKERDHELTVAHKARFLGLEVNELDEKGLQQIEPHIAIDALGAIHYECDGHMTPNGFMEKMKTFLVAQGVKILTEQEVIGFGSAKNRITAVQAQDATYEADEVVLAAGAWSGKMASSFGLQLPLQAGKGYRINVAQPTGITMPAILMEAKMAVTPMEGFTRFAGTMEFSGINQNIRKERVAAIAKGAMSYYRNLQIPQEAQQAAACGMRPVSPDGLPYIGRTSRYKNLVVATGHAMMGWSLGPVTGKLVEELITGQKTSLSLAPFSPERYF